ncbi:MAG: hypothetical protein GX638_18050, partial [Crenarchaeota archaeon]|nr:hypothetical protein [Thermoproteota archaeon]
MCKHWKLKGIYKDGVVNGYYVIDGMGELTSSNPNDKPRVAGYIANRGGVPCIYANGVKNIGNTVMEVFLIEAGKPYLA